MKVIGSSEIESMSDTLTPSWGVSEFQELVRRSPVKKHFWKKMVLAKK